MPEPRGVSPSEGKVSSSQVRQPRVVVADDDRDTVLTLMALLRAEGYDTRGVYDGAKVIEVVREFAADAVLLDIGMPGRTGYEIARELTEASEKPPLLIAVTGWSKPSERILTQIIGFDHHVAKPYDPQEILALLAPLKAISR